MDTAMQIIRVIQRHLQLITLADVLDIAITSFVIYKLVILIRRSRAAKAARALLIFFLVLWIASSFRLHVISFVLRRAAELGLLALVIVFQPEIRRVLEQVGSGSISEMIFGKSAADSDDEVDVAISQTVAAYTALSKDKVGALMVFERRIPLDELLKTGTALNAGVNAELLKNIFWNKAPLHDGAVIVREGRIVGAGCVLPLSGNVNLSKELGMRHRAAIGMSETSDAIVAIVSEETGSISVAVDGMLKRHLAPETLDRLLRNELLPEEKEPALNKLNVLDRLNLDRFKKKEADKHE